MLATLVILVLAVIALSVYNTVQLKNVKKSMKTEVSVHLESISNSLSAARLGYVRGETRKVSAYGSSGKRERVVEDGDEVRLSGEEFQFPGKDTPGFTNGANSKLRVDDSRWVGVSDQTDESDLDSSV